MAKKNPCAPCVLMALNPAPKGLVLKLVQSPKNTEVYKVDISGRVGRIAVKGGHAGVSYGVDRARDELRGKQAAA